MRIFQAVLGIAWKMRDCGEKDVHFVLALNRDGKFLDLGHGLFFLVSLITSNTNSEAFRKPLMMT